MLSNVFENYIHRWMDGISFGVQIVLCELSTSLAPAIYPAHASLKRLWSSPRTLQTSNIDPTYVFATPVWRGQLAASLAGAYGRSIAGLSGTLTESVGGITVTKQGAIEDARDGRSLPGGGAALEQRGQ